MSKPAGCKMATDTKLRVKEINEGEGTVVHGECVTNIQSRCSLLNSKHVNAR